jgi:acetolactate synthase-1/2/3 large subunit
VKPLATKIITRPNRENAYGGVAQSWSESIPILVMPMGYARRIAFLSEGLLLETADSEALTRLKNPYARMLFEASL